MRISAQSGKRQQYLVLQQVCENRHGAVDCVNVLNSEASAHVRSSGNCHSLNPCLKKVQIGEDSQERSMPKARLCMLSG